MYATTEGTTRYIDRFPRYRDAAFYRTILDLNVSSLGIGTYLGAEDDGADQAYTEALVAAGAGGIRPGDVVVSVDGKVIGSVRVWTYSSPRDATSRSIWVTKQSPEKQYLR